MHARSRRPPAVPELVATAAIAGRDPAFAAELTAWASSSARFEAFAGLHRDKIAKKLRGAADPDALKDVRQELSVARAILSDRRFELEYEPFGSGRRGPDFRVTFRTRTRLALEVTRPHRAIDAAGLTETVLAKLHQLPPSIANVLLVAETAPPTDAARPADPIDVGGTIRALRARADARDEAFLMGRGHASARAFYERFLRLGAVILWAEAGGEGRRAIPWVNASARIPVPAAVMHALVAAIGEAERRAAPGGHRAPLGVR